MFFICVLLRIHADIVTRKTADVVGWLVSRASEGYPASEIATGDLANPSKPAPSP